MYGMSSVTAAHAPNAAAYFPPFGNRPTSAEDPQPEPDAHADDQREQELALDVARDRLLHPHDQPAAAVRRESSVDGLREPLHVEQDVDRDDDEEDRVEEEGDDREPGALRPVQGLRRVLLDVLRPDLVEELLALPLDVDAAQVVVVEPDLEAREILLGAGPRRVSGIGRKVVVDPVGARCASAARPPWRERGSPVRRLLRRRDRRAQPPRRAGSGPDRARGRAG